MDKWDYRINVEEVSTKDLNKYIESRILAYEDEEVYDNTLWEVFKVEFKAFTSIILNKISS